MTREPGGPENLSILDPVFFLVQEDEVRSKLQDAIDLRRLRATDLLDAAHAIGRVDAEFCHPDYGFAEAEVKNQLGEAGAQRHDAHVPTLPGG